MIYSVKGRITHKGLDWLVLEANGIGYKVYTDISKVEKDKEYTFLVHEYIRENRYDLFGFHSQEDLEIFESLLDVNGVGPKMALSLVNGLGRERLLQSLEKGETKALTAAPGVGQKLANKIIVELKGKVDKLFLSREDEFTQALETLGYKKNEIASLYNRIPDDLTELESKIKWALKNLSR